MFVQRIRVRFTKTGELKAISHLDLMRAFERSLRRTGLPLRMTEGFNPHPRLNFPAPLGVGFEGTDEVMEFDLADWVGPREVEERLRPQLPPGLDLLDIKPAAPDQPARAREVTYRLTPAQELRDEPRLAPEALAGLIAQTDISVRRHRKGKDKTVNIRPFILSLTRDGTDLLLELKAGPEGSVHPEEVLRALGLDAPVCRTHFRIVRTRVQLAN